MMLNESPRSVYYHFVTRLIRALASTC